MRYYFDTLPLHPQPEPLESLTSFLARLAEPNHFYGPQAFLDNFWRKLSNAADQADYPPISFGRLPDVAACEETSLWRTTFYHLGKKFHCSNNRGAIAHFLIGSLSQDLRYCPKCIEEHGYYFLPWRFLCLSGCAEHGCRLLDRCGHCGQVIPLFMTPLKIGSCPRCKGSLRTCRVEQLPQREGAFEQTRFGDLAFLLTPHPCEESTPHLLAVLGRQFAQLRKQKRLRQVDVDSQLRSPSDMALHIEHGIIRRNTSLPHLRHSFQRYLKYADLLGVSFFDLFTGALRQEIAGEEPRMNTQQSQVRGLLSHKLAHQVEAVLQEPERTELNNHIVLLQRGREAQVSYPEELGQEEPSLSRQDGFILYKDINKRASLLEQKWLDKVCLVYDQLTARGEPVTITAICQTVPVSNHTLYKYPKIQAFLVPKIQDRRYQRLRRKAQLLEETLLMEIYQAIAHLKAGGHLVTQAAISELVHMPLQSLRRYPDVKVLFDQISVEEKQAKSMLHEEGLLKQLQEAIALLESQGQEVTQKAVGEILHCSVVNLAYRHPRIKAFWQEVCAKRSCQKKARAKQREEQLLKQTQDAINLLQLEGKPITITAIAKLVGATTERLQYYQQVAVLLGAMRSSL